MKISKAGDKRKPSYEEEDPLLVHLTVTGRCHASYQGCINRIFLDASGIQNGGESFFEDTDPERDAHLVRFLSQKFPHKKVTVCFYGGEPFLALGKMAEVWKRLRQTPEESRFRFLVYTSGEFLSQAYRSYPDFVKDIWNYSVSIDEDKEQHERVRRGTRLHKIKKNLNKLVSNYSGNIVFWSTLREGQSLWRCFQEFLDMRDSGLVHHMFWHFAESLDPMREFRLYYNQYQNDLSRVMETYVRLLKDGQLLSILHLNELVLYLLSGKERGRTACVVELSQNYDILSGKYYPCTDLPFHMAIGGMDEHGEVLLQDKDLSCLVSYKDKLGCYSCRSHFYCGGRCPVQALYGSEKRTEQYCELMHLHIDTVENHLPEIKDEFTKQGIDLQNVYDKSAYLAAYTDVVP